MLGTNLKNARLDLGYTQEKVAEQVGVKQQAIAAIEKGLIVPTVPTLVKLVEVLKLSELTIAELIK